MSKGTIQKRLHISGLTPSITINDIDARLSGFGHVLAVNGFGALDAVGQPRKFAYVTLEATESNLARCLNVLSGTTWKGAKLRIGEAKPDYVQRLEAERDRAAEEAEERPSKRRRLPRGVQGVHSKDMSPVDVHNVDGHAGWHKTTLMHLIRPMKMRPSHPLTSPMLSVTRKNSDSSPKKSRKPKLMRLEVPTRARVRTIDPRLYGAIHLRENMLDAVVTDTRATPKLNPRTPSPPPSSSDDENSIFTPPLDPDLIPASKRPVRAQSDALSAVPDLEEERKRDLGLLVSMFGDGASDWGGKESVDFDMDPHHADAKDDEVDAESDLTSEAPETEPPGVVGVAPHAVKPQPKSLKDMFKPHEEEAGFSLLSGLGELDIDPGFELDLAVSAPAPAVASSAVRIPQDSTPAQSFTTPSLTLNPALPFFFPEPDGSRAKDLFGIAHAEGWEFGRSGDADTIRQRWDAAKRPLTQQWKKRSREAVKARKRRYGVAEGEET